MGTYALQSNTTGSGNNSLGSRALKSNTTGLYNLAIGSYSLYSNVGNSRSVAIGHSAMYFADDRSTGRTTGNTAVGYESLKGGSTTPSNNTGQNNTALGYQTLTSNTSGSNNTAIGYSSMSSSSTYSNSTALGYNAQVTASNQIQLGDANITDVKTSGALTAGDVTYPKTHGTANQVLSTTGSGTLAWSTPAGGVYLYQKTNNSTTLTSNVQNLISLSLPAGSYLVTYTGMAYAGTNVAEYVASRIAISNPGNLGGGDAIVVNGTVNDGRAYVVHQLGITLTTAGSVSVWANNIYGTSNAYLLNSRLTAVQVGSVIDQ